MRIKAQVTFYFWVAVQFQASKTTSLKVLSSHRSVSFGTPGMRDNSVQLNTIYGAVLFRFKREIFGIDDVLNRD